MAFKGFAAIVFGLTLLGFSLGMVLGVYLAVNAGGHSWAYLSVPLMGAGSAVAAYGTLSATKKKENSEDHDG
jgi:hypothetical protein